MFDNVYLQLLSIKVHRQFESDYIHDHQAMLQLQQTEPNGLDNSVHSPTIYRAGLSF